MNRKRYTKEKQTFYKCFTVLYYVAWTIWAILALITIITVIKK